MMVRLVGSVRTTVCALSPARHARPSRAATLALVSVLAVVVALLPAREDARAGVACDRTSGPEEFASQIAAARPGQTICLRTGDYGTWNGTGKAITVRAAPGGKPTMKVSFGPGDSGFTLDGLRGMGGLVTAGARDFTIRNSTFTSPIRIEATNANIMLDRNRHDWNAIYDGYDNAKIFVLECNRRVLRRHGAPLHDPQRRPRRHPPRIRRDQRSPQHVRQPLRHRNEPHRQHPVRGRYRRPSRRQLHSRRRRLRHSRHHELRRRHGRRHDRRQRRRHPAALGHRALRRQEQHRAPQHGPLLPRSDCPFNLTCGQIDINRKSERPRRHRHPGLRQHRHQGELSPAAPPAPRTTTSVAGARATWVRLPRTAGFELARKSPGGRRRASDGLDVGARINVPRSAGADGRLVGSSGSTRRWIRRSSTICSGRPCSRPRSSRLDA